MLEEALEITTRLLRSDTPVSYAGKHFTLDEAILLPRPARRTPILIGGNGPQKTLPLVAQYADEWNAVYLALADYKSRAAHLDALLRERERAPGDVKRSLMTQVIYAPDEATLNARLDAWFGKRNQPRGTADDLFARGILAGTPAMLIDQIGAYTTAGVQRFMFQWLDQDDIAGLENFARDVLPHFHKA